MDPNIPPKDDPRSGTDPDPKAKDHKPPAPPPPPVNPTVPRQGVPGFHPKQENEQDPDLTGRTSGSGGTASLELDPDSASTRVNTGTGDQPGNIGGSRTGTPPQP